MTHAEMHRLAAIRGKAVRHLYREAVADYIQRVRL